MKDINNTEIPLPLLVNRSYLYRLFRRIFAGEPDEEMLAVLRSDMTGESLALALGEERETAAVFPEERKKETDMSTLIERLRGAYMRLFVGPAGPEAMPWECVHMGMDGLLFQESTLPLRECYRRFGLLPACWPGVSDDSLALELGFLSELAGRSVEALQRGDKEELRQILDASGDFLSEHLLRWVPKMAERMRASERDGFYSALLQTLLRFMRKDWEMLETIRREGGPGAEWEARAEVLRREDLLGAAADEHLDRGVTPENRLRAADDVMNGSLYGDTGEERWLAAPCWHNCGGTCLVRVLLKDGVVLRQGTDSLHADDEFNRQQRACLRGFSQQFQVHGADRLKYPLRRRHWSPDNPNPQLRGRDEWERITWEEAASCIHDELKRVSAAWGDNSILALGSACESLLNRLNINYLTTWSTSSWGSWFAPGVLGWGDGCNYYDCHNDRLDFVNCDYVVAFGYNPAWAALGNATNYALSWKKAGVKFILFDPICTDTCAILDARWIPIRPGTDMAAMMAMSYVLLEEDEEGSLIDWDFLDRCCVGQDRFHMPDDARTDENYFDYLRGRYDGVAKTPRWAEEITGVPEDTLRQVARILGRKNNVAILSSWASARTYDTEQLPQTAICLGAMGGHIGKSGNSVGPTGWNHTNNYGPRLVRAGSGGPSGCVAGSGRATFVCESQLWKAVKGEPFNPTEIFMELNEAGPDGWKDVVRRYDLTRKAESVTAPVKMIWSSNAAKLNTCEGAREGIEAVRSVEFVVAQGHFLNAANRYADIVLPVTTEWEREGAYVWEGRMNRDTLFVSRGFLPPFYESKSDREAIILIGEKFGLSPETWSAVSDRQRLFNAVASSQVIREDGETWENLVSVTREDLAQWEVDGAPQEGRIPIGRFMEDGEYRVERHPGDRFGFIHKKEFREDPAGHPIGTRSGKIEFACQSWADILNSQGFSGERFSAVPKYRPPFQGFEDCFTDGKPGGKKSAYPLQCINPHYHRRAHSVFDNVPWLREACPNPVFLSREDAGERGIRDGDTVLISSRYGQTLRRACVTGRVMPGVIGLPHGPWLRVDEESGIDRAGAENYITGQHAGGMGCSGYNTLNVEVRKYDGEPLPADTEALRCGRRQERGESP